MLLQLILIIRTYHVFSPASLGSEPNLASCTNSDSSLCCSALPRLRLIGVDTHPAGHRRPTQVCFVFARATHFVFIMAAMAQEPEDIKDMEAFLKMAKYPLVKHTDMTQEMREEAMDTCITAVEKHHADMEKCTQVGLLLTAQ